jgi:hypothetical protein
MARNLGLDEVVDHFTLIGDELELLRNKSGATRLGFAALLKHVMWRGRFPPGAHELPQDAVAHLARQVRVSAGELASYDFATRTAQRHRTEIRAYTGFRECSVADAETLRSWLAERVAVVERRELRVREELLTRCRAQLIEPPTPDRVAEITRSALHRAEQTLLGRIAARVDAVAVERLEALIAVSDDDDDGEDVLALIKAAPGNVSLDTMLVEMAKLEAIRAIGLPSDLFADIARPSSPGGVPARWSNRPAICASIHSRRSSRCCARCSSCVSGRSPTRSRSCSSRRSTGSTRMPSRRSSRSSSRTSAASAARTQCSGRSPKPPSRPRTTAFVR